MIRVVHPGSGSRIRIPEIPDPNFFSSRIRMFSIPDPESESKNLSILTKKWFPSSWKYDPGCSSRMRIPDPNTGLGSESRIRILIFYPSRIPGSKIGSGSRIRSTAKKATVDPDACLNETMARRRATAASRTTTALSTYSSSIIRTALALSQISF